MKGELKKLKKILSEKERVYLWLNLTFIFVFLNIWDYVLNRAFFNGMILGFIMFGPVAFLWFLKRFRAVVLLTLLSLFEFMAMLVFVWEGFALSGVNYSSKSIFWIVYLVAAGINLYWGLSIYSKEKGRV